MGSQGSKYVIVTHNDLDGEAAAAAYLRIVNTRPEEAHIEFAEPYELHLALQRAAQHVVSGGSVALMDLGFNAESTPKALNIIRDLVANGVRVEWYDHHIWSDEEAGLVRQAGAELYIDRSTCGAGVVIHYASKTRGLEPDEYLLRLERAVCAADLWRWDDPMAPRLFRASSSYSPNGSSTAKWRLAMIQYFYEGQMWNEAMELRLRSYLQAELASSTSELDTVSVSSHGPCRAAAVLRTRDLPSDSIMGSILVSRYKASMGAMVKRRGLSRVSLSLRSRGSANVQVIAKALGGGGHPRAAGAAMNVPLIVYLLSYVYPRVLTAYVARRVSELAASLGACNDSVEVQDMQ